MYFSFNFTIGKPISLGHPSVSFNFLFVVNVRSIQYFFGNDSSHQCFLITGNFFRLPMVDFSIRLAVFNSFLSSEKTVKSSANPTPVSISKSGTNWTVVCFIRQFDAIWLYACYRWFARNSNGHRFSRTDESVRFPFLPIPVGQDPADFPQVFFGHTLPGKSHRLVQVSSVADSFLISRFAFTSGATQRRQTICVAGLLLGMYPPEA